jgi:hypothetical protein
VADETTRSIALDILKALIRPIVRYCLRNSYSYQDLARVSKEIFVREAEQELARSSYKSNVSRISVLTGLPRHEVNRLLDEEHATPTSEVSVFGRVIGQWRQDRQFRTRNGEPRALTFRGDNCDFKKLVESVTTAINHATVLFELKRMHFVEVDDDKVKLLRQSFSFEGDPRGGFALLSRDLDSLINAVEQNLKNPKRYPNLHIRTEYDNILTKHLPEIRKWLVEEGRVFHRRAREFIAQFDKDINPEIAYEEGKSSVVLGAFSLTSLEDIVLEQPAPPLKANKG